MKNSARPSALPTLGWLAAAAMLGMTLSAPAAAALGADVSSVETDRVTMHGELRLASAAGYLVHEIRTPMNTMVREYISPAGKVFAVSWRGPVLPDLRQVLGNSFEQYQAATATPHVGHRQLNVARPDLVIRSSGRMRAFYGRAWIPGLLPANFSIGDIQ